MSARCSSRKLRSVTRINEKGFGADFAEANELLDRAKRGRSIVMLARDFDEPIHAQLRQHRRFYPRLLVDRNRIVRRDLCGRCPERELFERQRTKNAAVFVFS